MLDWPGPGAALMILRAGVKQAGLEMQCAGGGECSHFALNEVDFSLAWF